MLGFPALGEAANGRVACAKPVRFLAYVTLSCYRRLVMRRHVSRLPSKRDQVKTKTFLAWYNGRLLVVKIG
jgi:hypothetical protein